MVYFRHIQVTALDGVLVADFNKKMRCADVGIRCFYPLVFREKVWLDDTHFLLSLESPKAMHKFGCDEVENQLS